jgi:heme/copper-type cytochrome/quinol oxidase subunit 3
MKDAMDALAFTIGLGIIFIALQTIEYYESYFDFSDSVYSCSFYTLTGLHGCHVIAGVSFLTVCYIRLISRHYMLNHYLGFVFAIRY